MERAISTSKLKKALDLAFIPGSIYRVWSDKYNQPIFESGKDHMDLADTIYAVEKIVTGAVMVALEGGRVIGYSTLTKHMLENLQ